MTGPRSLGLAIRLAWASTRQAWLRSVLLVGCLALGLALPPAGRAVVARVSDAVLERAATVPIVVGAPGSRFDLVLSSLYFRGADFDAVAYREYESLLRDPSAAVVPMHARFTARDRPLVATDVEYLQRRGLRAAAGRLFASMGEAVLGARAAAELGLGPGDTISTDQRLAYDITETPSIRLNIVGVLTPTDSPDDGAVFVDIETAWLVEGIAHGHADAESMEGDTLVLGRTESHTSLSLAAPTIQEVTPSSLADFHLHGDRGELPLTAILVYPRNAKAGTILSTEINASKRAVAVEPLAVAEELLAFVVRARAAADVVGGVLVAVTLVLAGLLAMLIAKIRGPEYATLTDIGISRRFVVASLAAEVLGVVIGACLLAAVLVAVVDIAAVRLLTGY